MHRKDDERSVHTGCEGRVRTFQDLGQCPWVPRVPKVVCQFPDTWSVAGLWVQWRC